MNSKDQIKQGFSKSPSKRVKWVRLTLISLLFHLVSIPILVYFLKVIPKNLDDPKNQPIKIRFQPPPENGKIVDVEDPSSITDEPVESKYLSNQNRKVLKERKAKQAGKNKSASKTSQQKKSTSIDDLLKLPGKFIRADSEKNYIQQDSGASGSPNNYLPDISIGDLTQLNTQNFTYASFFIRMKRQMEDVWNPRPIIFTQGLNDVFYVTKIRILLLPDGKLKLAEIIKSSGNRALDQEALETVYQAAPYLNPPSQLINQESKLIEIPSWGFVISRN